MSLFLRRNAAGNNDEVLEYLRHNVRGQTTYQISAAILANTKEPLKGHKYRRLQRAKLDESPHSDKTDEDQVERICVWVLIE